MAMIVVYLPLLMYWNLLQTDTIDFRKVGLNMTLFSMECKAFKMLQANRYHRLQNGRFEYEYDFVQHGM